MARDEQLYLFILFALLIDFVSSSLKLMPSEIGPKNVDEIFLVFCRDEAGSLVTWKGPKGFLNAKTVPMVRPSSHGMAIVFNKTKLEDAGNYTCMLNNPPRERISFQLIVEEHITLPTTTENEIFIDYTHNEGPQVRVVLPTPVEKKKEHKPISNSRNMDKTYYIGQNNRRHNSAKHEPKITANAEKKLEAVNTPLVQVATEGQSFLLKCKPNLKKARVSITLENGESLGRRFVKRPDGLYIANVSREDGRLYRCEIENPDSGFFILKNLTLIVKHKPVLPYSVFAEEEEVFAFEGESVNLTCEVEANPAPRFLWHHRKTGQVIPVSTHKSVLQLNVTERTPGTYQCTAYNELGRLEKFFDVQLGEHPDRPTNITLEEATEDSLDLKITLPDIPGDVSDPLMDPQWVVVQYKPVSEDEWVSTEFNITSESFTLTDLQKDTEYEIRAATRNIAGLSEYSDAVFKTSPATRVHTELPVTFIAVVTILIAVFLTA